jgi:hypothetical protein
MNSFVLIMHCLNFFNLGIDSDFAGHEFMCSHSTVLEHRLAVDGGTNAVASRIDVPTPERGNEGVSEKKNKGNSVASITWHEDYSQAVAEAERQGRMLFIYFCDPCGGGDNCDCERFKKETLDDPVVCSKLCDYVCLRLPLDTSIMLDGKKTVLLKNAAFKEMLGKPGIAIIDYVHQDVKLYGMVVSTFPITRSLWYTPEKMAVILQLPPGTLTQRTLIYAVRTHPEKPASTQSEANPFLLEEAQDHSQHQADIRLQGHHQWDFRFRRIGTKINLSAREVCAESWPGENLVEAAVECVRCWRLSSGHWSAVRAPNRMFGYDMKRGQNGIWYATGIFGGK